jgi:hypothetical protein
MGLQTYELAEDRLKGLTPKMVVVKLSFKFQLGEILIGSETRCKHGLRISQHRPGHGLRIACGAEERSGTWTRTEK